MRFPYYRRSPRRRHRYGCPLRRGNVESVRKMNDKRSTTFVERFRTGGDRNLGYLAADPTTKEAAVIDPSYDPASIARFASQRGYRIVHAFCTHDHADHTNGNQEFERVTGIRPLLYGDRDRRSGRVVEDGAEYPLGSLSIRVIHTPGHTPDSICLLIGDALFTGDTLFVGKVGGTDYGEGAWAEYESLHNRLLTLPPETRVYPGHDVGPSPESTIGRERRENPFLLRPDFASFVRLKKNWQEYKRKHGIA